MQFKKGSIKFNWKSRQIYSRLAYILALNAVYLQYM